MKENVMANDEENKKAAALLSLPLIKALLEIYGYGPVYLGPVEDILLDKEIVKWFEEGKNHEEIVRDSGRSLSTVKRRKKDYLNTKDKNSDK